MTTNDNAKLRPIERPLVVLPTFNEASNISELIDALIALPRQVSVLVVDDASPDGTGGVVKQSPLFDSRVFLIERSSRIGFASACKAGFEWGLRNGFDACVEMDADFSHDPRDVPRLLRALEESADFVVGSRYLDGVRVLNWPPRRLLLSLFAGAYIRFLTGLPLTDPTSGFNAVRREVLGALDWSRFTAEGYGFLVEFHFFCWLEHFALREEPIIFTERHSGGSKMSRRIQVESAFRVLQLAIHGLARRLERHLRRRSSGDRTGYPPR